MVVSWFPQGLLYPSPGVGWLFLTVAGAPLDPLELHLCGLDFSGLKEIV